MYRIMYMSNAKFLFEDKDLEKLLMDSRINNSKLNITGLLVVKGKHLYNVLRVIKKMLKKFFIE